MGKFDVLTIRTGEHVIVELSRRGGRERIQAPLEAITLTAPGHEPKHSPRRAGQRRTWR